jgi:hypothetical protein
MREQPENHLETFIDQELRRLPDLEAPPGLLNSVLKELQRRQSLPWWRRSIWYWPASARIAAFSSLALLAAGWILVGMGYWFDWNVTMPHFTGWWPTVASEFGRWQNAFRLGVSWIQTTLEMPWVWGAILFCGAAYLTLIGVGSALVRFSFQRSSPP